jgi:hypothetical protein
LISVCSVSSSISTLTMIGASYRTHLRMVCPSCPPSVGVGGQRIEGGPGSLLTVDLRLPGCCGAPGVELDDLIASWTLVDADQELLVGKHDVPRLSCAVMARTS